MTERNVPYRFEFELEVSASPEQVWRAIATAEGLSGWMMPADFEAVVGSELAFHMGPDASSHGHVTEVEEGRRISYEEDWATLGGHEGADVTPLLTEFLVDAGSGGTCTVRIVTSAFGTGADWEREFFDEMTVGWAPMLDNLRLYLSEFPGQEATAMWVTTEFAAPPEAAVAAVRRAFGIDAVGDRAEAVGLTGEVRRTIPRHFLLRVDAPVEGFLSCFSYGAGEASGVILQGYIFSEGAAAYVEREQPAWQAWLEGLAADMEAARSS